MFHEFWIGSALPMGAPLAFIRTDAKQVAESKSPRRLPVKEQGDCEIVRDRKLTTASNIDLHTADAQTKLGTPVQSPSQIKIYDPYFMSISIGIPAIQSDT